jgi:hypothetical protein
MKVLASPQEMNKAAISSTQFGEKEISPDQSHKLPDFV